MHHTPGNQIDMTLLFARDVILFYIEAHLVLMLLGSRQRADRLLDMIDLRRIYAEYKDRQRHQRFLNVLPNVAKSPPTCT